MKRILAMLLVLALAVPFTVYATEPTTAPELETTVEPETVPETLVTEETVDIDGIAPYVVASSEYLLVIAGCVVFFTIVVLCFFVYKFFRMFF